MTQDAAQMGAAVGAAVAVGWDCPVCGHKNITTNFCPDCGGKKPEAKTGWDCAQCGTKNIQSRFCPNCGAKAGGIQRLDLPGMRHKKIF